MDEFKVHKIGDCVQNIQKSGTEVEFVHPGYTSLLQPLDVSINKPFKDVMMVQFEEFLTNNPNGTKITRKVVAVWIANAWETISTYCITNG